MTASAVYNSIADFIASLDPQRVLDLRADEAMQDRLEELIGKEKEEGLDAEEKDELDHYIVIERLVRLAKSKALYRLSQ